MEQAKPDVQSRARLPTAPQPQIACLFAVATVIVETAKFTTS
jgi:hypothetical protein